MTRLTKHNRFEIIFSEQNHEEIFNSMLDPIVIYHVDENKNFIRFIRANKAFFTIYGYSQDELKALKFEMISAEKDKVSNIIHEIGQRKISLFETMHMTKSSKVFPVEVHSNFIDLEGEKAIVSIIRDITIRKQNEEKLLALNQSKDNILKVVSHDLRNPLAQIQGVIHILQKDSDPESLQQYLTLLDESREHAEDIVRELLSTGDIEGDVNLTFNPINVNDFCRKIIKHYKVLAKSKKGITLNESLLDNKMEILADEKKLTRVFDNIISNAVKFSFKDAEIEFRVMEKDGSVQFSVQDYGMGIPDELKDMIFDKQTKAKRKGTMGEKTIGLGMYITKTIVELHNGKIWFESTKDQGTTFCVTLPLRA